MPPIDTHTPAGPRTTSAPEPLPVPLPVPLLVPVQESRRLLGVGNTKIWAMIGAGTLKTVRIGRRRMVVYASLRRLAEPDAAE